ncbi:MAG: sulfite exporter TauE/SafE family protein [Nevskiales bacterium]
MVIGFLSGLFGVGGSSISTPALRVFLHTPQLIALGSPLPVAIPTAIVGGFIYQRAGLVHWQVVRWVVAAAVPGVIVGSLLTLWVPADWLMYLVAGTVIIVGIQLFRQAIPAPTGSPDGVRESSMWLNAPRLPVILVSLFIGLASGLLANGGGFLLVPAFVLIFGARVREAAATSLPCVALMAVPGTATHAALGHIDWRLALELTVGVMPATYLGVFLSLKFRSVRMRRPFGVFLAAFGLYFLIRELM